MKTDRRHPANAVLTLLRAAACSALLSPLAQASDHVPPPPQRVPLLISNATLHPVGSADIVGGRMLVDQGRIVALLAPGQPVPATSVPPQVVDLGGRHVYPGFVSAYSTLGLVEVNSVRATVDTTELGAINPNARALVAVNPDSELLPVARSNGVLTALTAPESPRSGGIGGTSALIQLDGWTWADMALQPAVALHVRLPSLRLNSDLLAPPLDALADELRKFSAQRLKQIDDAFETAAAYARTRSAVPATPVDARWEAMRPVFSGERPVFVLADDIAQIRHALAMAERFGFKLVIVGGADAARVAELLRVRQVPVLIGGVHELPLRRDDDVDAKFRLAAELQRAGVRFAIARNGDDRAASSERNLPYEAATAAAYGLPRDEALKAITLYPAQILGVDDRVGSLAPGRLGSFIVTDGDPLETTTQVQRVFIQGREVEVTNRQTRLTDKYRQKYEQLKAR